MVLHYKDVPIGVKCINRISRFFPQDLFCRTTCYQSSVLFLSFIAYTTYHLSRKPISIVKNVLYQNCSLLIPPYDLNITNENKDTWCDWAPFHNTSILEALDFSFLFAYGAGMFVSGFVAERVNLRYFLTIGMILSGIFSYMFGIAYNYNIHSLWYFVVVQILAGFAQTTGWPGVVTLIGNWFGKGKRGMIFGIWNSHTSLGNILGSVLAGIYVETNWGLSFIVPGLIIAVVGFILFLFLVTSPVDVDCNPLNIQSNFTSSSGDYRRIDPRHTSETSSDDVSQEDSEDNNSNNYGSYYNVNNDFATNSEKAIGFIGACKIPGVLEFSLCLFFAKLVSYTFLYWLPQYIYHSTVLSPKQSADLSTLFDVGGIFGGILAGALNDNFSMSASICAVMLSSAVPFLFIYEQFGAHNFALNVILLLVVGIVVNGPYALITTEVSTELGTHPSLKGNSKALSTVTAIIDGTGSIGAAVGPLMAGIVSSKSWKSVFYLLMISDILALLFLSRLVKNEVKRFRHSRLLRHTL